MVLCHSVETAYSNINYMSLSEISQIFRIIFFTIGRLGVPIFLFLTGALTLKKQIDTDEDVLKFYKKNLLPLFITVEIWNVLYNIFLSTLNKSFEFRILIDNILFLKQVNLPNMWYMPMILGMYIAIPFIAKIVKSFSLKSLKIPLILVLVSSILLPSVNVILNTILKIGKYNIILDFSFLGGGYGLYILLGYFFSNGMLKKTNKMILVIISILTFGITVSIQYYAYYKGISYNVWYNFITIFLCTIFIFELFTRIKNSKENIFTKLTEYISKISLGIFFMHEIFLKLLHIKINELNFINPIKTIILFVLSFIGSTIFIYLFSKIKVIKEKVFLIKE